MLKPLILPLNTGDTKARQVLSNLLSPRTSQQLPEKVSRSRSNSTSMATPTQVSPPARKRTSSGVFQVDESEPIPKKSELSRPVESPKKKSDIANGCQESIEKALPEIQSQNDKREKGKEKKEQIKEGKEKKEQIKEQKKSKVVEKFDKEAKSNCVSAFKESDSWD